MKQQRMVRRATCVRIEGSRLKWYKYQEDEKGKMTRAMHEMVIGERRPRDKRVKGVE